ncbi:PepSY domain-containing protein [Rhizobium sp. KVB221]|uniref:PepSY domain-containing protein n=1 Tax=Rhizobium setariae TaxID=2801340 RepID=A0A936YKL2_9HYPH|nr:PepSY domain-containing protein [Rhizobium setariae]MBL0372104.1 PepSY domain-containing protein [Rhizobium setariae]
MRKIILAAVVLTTAFAGLARAEDTHDCGNVPKDKWMSEDALKEKAKGMGYDVRKIKVEGGCYEVYAIDSKGAKVETLFNPQTGEAVGNEAGE